MKLTVFFLSFAFVGVLSTCLHKTSQNGHREIPQSSGCIANRMMAPVCGDDGCWYTNKDFLACANKMLRDAGQPEVRVVDAAMCNTMSDQGNSTPPAPIILDDGAKSNTNNNNNNISNDRVQLFSSGDRK